MAALAKLRDQCARVILICAALFAGVAPQMAAAQSCQTPSDLVALNAAMLGFAEAQRTPTPTEVGRVRTVLAGLSEQAVLRELADADLGDLAPSVVHILAQANAVAISGAPSNAERLSDELTGFNDLVSSICDSSGLTIMQMYQKESLGGVIITDGVTADEVRRIVEQNEALAMGMLVTVLCVMIIGLYAIDTGFRWAMALVYNRKACRIAASIRIDGIELDGQVTTLGRGGCRMAPFAAAEFDKAILLLRRSGAEVVIGEHRLNVQASAIYDAYVDLKFEQRISVVLQKTLLADSTISPFYVRKLRKRQKTSALAQDDGARDSETAAAKV